MLHVTSNSLRDSECCLAAQIVGLSPFGLSDSFLLDEPAGTCDSQNCLDLKLLVLLCRDGFSM